MIMTMIGCCFALWLAAPVPRAHPRRRHTTCEEEGMLLVTVGVGKARLSVSGGG